MRLIRSMVMSVITAATVVTRLLIIRHLFFTQGFQALFGAIAAVSRTVFNHGVDHLIVAVKAFGLVIRTFIPAEIQPVHPVHNGVDSFLS